jgi:hypothetical protein
MVYKFLNEYLAKLQMLTAGQSSDGGGSSTIRDKETTLMHDKTIN